jgi:hypothetical protein
MGTNEVRAQETASGQPLVHALGVVPTELPAGMIPNLDQKPIFVSLQEKREIVHGSKVRNSRAGTSHTYAIKFFLVDSVGNSHFAAVGYDGGDSHYQYSNRPEFPPLSCHNKTEVKAWAERIINASQQSSGYRVDVVKDEVPSNGGSEAINLPQFVSYTEAKKDTPDGRRQICWYLLDSLGHNHLAVVGEEKDTRDGHYLYKTESVFDKVVPLEAHNQEEVKKWLNWMIGPRIGPMPAASASIAKGRLAGLSGMSERPMREAKRGRGRGRGRGGSGFGAHDMEALMGATRGRGRGRGRGRPRGAATFGSVVGTRGRGGAIARRGRGAFRLYDLDYDSRSVAASEVRKWLAEEVRCREEQKINAMDFIDDQLPAYEKDILERNIPKLDAVHSKIVAKVGGKKNAVDQIDPDEMVNAVAALRELFHLRPTLAMISDEKVTSMLQDIMENGPDVLGQSSRALLKKWLHVGTAHAAVFRNGSALYNKDPTPAVEAVLQSSAKFDRLVTSITHRKLGGTSSSGVQYPINPGQAASGSMQGYGQGMPNATSLGTGVGACGALASPGQGSEVSDVLESNGRPVGDDEVAILNPYQQQMAMQGVDF